MLSGLLFLIPLVICLTIYRLLFLSSRGALATKDLICIQVYVSEILRFALNDKTDFHKKLRVAFSCLTGPPLSEVFIPLG